MYIFNTQQLKYAKTYIKVHMITRMHVDKHSRRKESKEEHINS